MRDQQTFLEKISEELYNKFEDSISNMTIVLPNKRAKVFLIETLKSHASNTIFAPNIISIEDLIEDLSQLNKLDNFELLFEFYTVYSSLTSKANLQSFDQFANWAKIVIQDFNEIDRYLLDSKHVFSYLSDIEVLKRWDLEPEQRTLMIDNNIEFWSRLPLYYQSFYSHLLNLKVGYQGMLYREAISNLDEFVNSLGINSIVFAGFNALNQAEELIFQKCLESNKGLVYWDIDEVFFNDVFHDASLFTRRFNKQWPFYKHNSFDWIVNEFSSSKNINIIGTPKTVGQAKIAGKLVDDILLQNNNLNKVAVILGDENLLIPVLNALPQKVSALNITMGYNTKNNPAQILINKIFKLHINALSRSDDYSFYYKDLLDILNHPLLKSILPTNNVVSVINDQNIIFINIDSLLKLSGNTSDLLGLIFAKWSNNVGQIIDRLLGVLLQIKNSLQNDVTSDLISKSFVFALYKSLIQLKNYYDQYKLIDSVNMLYSIYKQTIDLIEVSFEGEPLSGLQVMGVLESRVLDFETVIITSLNEGVFPAGKSSNSFIPNDVKSELGLPTFKEKDAIYAYHFYHILLRAKNIYLLYNSDPSDGLDKGEKSRFITQLEVEKQAKHAVSHQIYNAKLPGIASEIKEVSKSEVLLNRLQDIAQNKGFSPSSLTNYLRDPFQFYKQRVLGVRDLEEVEENVAVNTLGTIIHNTLEELYKPLCNKYLSESDILNLLKIYPDEVFKQFKLEYKQGDITKGKNLIALEVAKRNVLNFLNYELTAIKNGDAIKVLYLERPLQAKITSELLPYPVIIAGKVDRIELRNNVYRIIDYKSGKVEAANLNLSDWSTLIQDDKKDKVIQLLCYALMFREDFKDLDLEVGINSFKNMKSGFMKFKFGKQRAKDAVEIVSDEFLENFKEQLILLITEILNPDIPFKQKITNP